MHPNTVKLHLQRGDKQVTVTGESRGGGVIKIAEVDGFEARFNARHHTLLVRAADIKGSVAFITAVLSHDDCNIATMTVSRKGKNDEACLILEMDSGIAPITLEYLKSLKWVNEITYMPEVDL